MIGILRICLPLLALFVIIPSASLGQEVATPGIDADTYQAMHDSIMKNMVHLGPRLDNPPPEYPGWKPDGSDYMNVAAEMVRWILMTYYMLECEWPASWDDVVSEGIIQAPLLGYKGEVIDPGDGSLDFPGDVCYPGITSTKGESEATLILVKQESVSRTYSQYTGPGGACNPSGCAIMEANAPNLTYAMALTSADEHYNNGEVVMRKYMLDHAQMQRFAILGAMKKCLISYRDVYDDVPLTFEEFRQSGFCPLDENSINPLNGDRFYGDGRANDFSYEYMPGYEDSVPHIKIVPIDGNGKQHDSFFSF